MVSILKQPFEINLFDSVGGLTHREHIMIIRLVVTGLVERHVLRREERDLGKEQHLRGGISSEDGGIAAITASRSTRSRLRPG